MTYVRAIQRVGEVIMVVGGVVGLGSLFWVKGPAVTPAQLGWGIAAGAVGLVIMALGAALIAFARARVEGGQEECKAAVTRAFDAQNVRIAPF